MSTNIIQTLLAWFKKHLEIIFQLSQIALAVVAIFGYFYTVQPIYQKERLAEQVAEYEGIIKTQTPKIAQAEKRLAELQGEREKLARDALSEREKLTREAQIERGRLTNELKTIERQLAVAREEKNKLERQTEFMTYQYRLPDGSPAVTREQVRTAQVFDLKRNFLSAISAACAYGIGGSSPLLPFSGPGLKDRNEKYWPFTEKELTIWKEQGTKYPLRSATECISSVAADFAKRYRQFNFSTEIEGLRTEALEYANRESAKTWNPPVQPDDILQEMAAKRSAIQAQKATDLKKVEEEYGDWESTLLPDRREILKHNYFVGKQNAETKASSDRLSLEFAAYDKASKLRQSVQDEVKRLLVSEAKSAKK
jgi:hypothetical protein